jgi:L-fuconolactonase
MERSGYYSRILSKCMVQDLRNGNRSQWEPEEFKPYMDVVVESFGTDRIMFGSDWPVCLLGASYEEVLNITRNYFSAFSSSEQDKFFGGNAMNFYNL